MNEPERYRRKPIEVDALRYTGTNHGALLAFLGGSNKAHLEKRKLPGPGRGMHEGLIIRTLQRRIPLAVGDWVLRTAWGEIYTRKPETFDASYERMPS